MYLKENTLKRGTKTTGVCVLVVNVKPKRPKSPQSEIWSTEQKSFYGKDIKKLRKA